MRLSKPWYHTNSGAECCLSLRLNLDGNTEDIANQDNNGLPNGDILQRGKIQPSDNNPVTFNDIQGKL